MKTLIFVLSFYGTFLALSTAKAQITEKPYLEGAGINISQKAFDKLVMKEIVLLKNHSTLQIQDIIYIVRLDNTIVFNDVVERKRSYKLLDSLTVYRFAKIYVRRLHTTWATGGGLYNKKYNICWGGVPVLNNNSIYEVGP